MEYRLLVHWQAVVATNALSSYPTYKVLPQATNFPFGHRQRAYAKNMSVNTRHLGGSHMLGIRQYRVKSANSLQHQAFDLYMVPTVQYHGWLVPVRFRRVVPYRCVGYVPQYRTMDCERWYAAR